VGLRVTLEQQHYWYMCCKGNFTFSLFNITGVSWFRIEFDL
jgi:hypothetical protein